MLRLVRPRYFVPVHGEYRHLVRHRGLAQSVGMAPEATFLLEDGHVLEIDAGGARVAEPVHAGRVFVDGKGIGDVEDVVLRDRRHLSSDGLVLAILAIDQHSGEIIAGPDLVSRGFIVEEHGQEYLERAKGVVIDTLQQITAGVAHRFDGGQGGGAQGAEALLRTDAGAAPGDRAVRHGDVTWRER